MFDIFISYKNDGQGNHFAARLSKDLSEKGYSVYYNPNEQRSGDFPGRIKNAINECKDFVVIVSQGYIDSLLANNNICWVREELLWSKKMSKQIIPVLINGMNMPSDERVFSEELRFFPRIDAISFIDEYLTAPFDKLTSRLKSENDGSDSYRDVKCSNYSTDFVKILDHILEKAENKDPEAMYQVGMMYYHGIITDRNYKKAAKWMKLVSQTNTIYAIYADTIIARMFYAGVMPLEEQSYEKSFEYHKKAELDPYSMSQIAFMQQIGSGCEYFYNSIESYYLQILDKTDPLTTNSLGEFYEKHGEFVKATKMYERVKDIIPEAAFRLGRLYKIGVLSEPHKPDYDKALPNFVRASELGHVEATYECGVLYFNPVKGFPKDFERAQDYFTKAADMGSNNAAYILAYMFENGHVEQDYKKAIHYYKMAADQGHILSAAQLGELYQLPEVHNYQQAYKYSKLAADHGSALGCLTLGTLYMLGRGCHPDETKAYIYLKKAAEGGIHEAEEMLNIVEGLFDE